MITMNSNTQRIKLVSSINQEKTFKATCQMQFNPAHGTMASRITHVSVIFSHSCTCGTRGVSTGMVFMSGTRPKRTPMQKLLRFAMGIISIATIIWGLYLIPYNILREERFRLFGEERTSGLVISVYTDEMAQDLGSRFVIEYKYVDMDGFARTTTAPLPRAIWQKYRPGSRIKVFYPHTQPNLARVPNEIEPRFQIWLRNRLQ